MGEVIYSQKFDMVRNKKKHAIKREKKKFGDLFPWANAAPPLGLTRSNGGGEFSPVYTCCQDQREIGCCLFHSGCGYWYETIVHSSAIYFIFFSRPFGVCVVVGVIRQIR